MPVPPAVTIAGAEQPHWHVRAGFNEQTDFDNLLHPFVAMRDEDGRRTCTKFVANAAAAVNLVCKWSA
jgi:hypothetical protein